MVILDDLRVEMVNYRSEMKELSDVLNLKKAEEELAELREEISKDGFWDDLENSQKILQKSKGLENKINDYNKLNNALEDIIALIELSIEEDDESSIDEIIVKLHHSRKNLKTKSFPRVLRENTIKATLFLHSMRVQAVQKLRTGRKCCTECIINGQKAIISRLHYWIILTVMMPA